MYFVVPAENHALAKNFLLMLTSTNPSLRMMILVDAFRAA
jgi:citrate synthase